MSRFVSAGTTEAPKESESQWLEAQAEIEAKTQAKLREGKQADGKTLYEVLQANKAAKQEAFEESQKLKNQFRALDDDEIEFLDAVTEASRAKEAAVAKETTDQLEEFRRQRGVAEKAAQQDEQEVSVDSWASAGRKRKKGREAEAVKGIKLRKSSSSNAADNASGTPRGQHPAHGGSSRATDGARHADDPAPVGKEVSRSKDEGGSDKKSGSLGLLAGYSSDED